MDPPVTPPSSPDASRLLTKRRCPFGESPQQPKVAAICDSSPGRHVHRGLGQDFVHLQQEIKSGFSAFQIMMHSQKAQANLQTQNNNFMPPSTTTFGKCWVCQQHAETLPCAFCEHGACEMCIRQCDKCFGVYCSFCSTINYDHHDDCALCLTCNAEEFKRQKNRTMASQSQWVQQTVGERFSQVMA